MKLFITAIHILLSFLLIILLVKSGLIPVSMLIVTGGILFLISGSIILLFWKAQKLWFHILALLLALFTIVVYIFLINYLIEGIKTLNKVTEIAVTHTDIGIFTKGDTDITVTDMDDYTFGILETLDRENTDKALRELKSIVGTEITTRVYAGLPQLLDSILLYDQSDAIIMNTAFVDLFSDLEGYDTAADQLHQVYIQKIEETVQQDNIVEMERIGSKEKDKAEDGEDYIFTMYISGIDSRNGLVSKSRTDVNILATVNTETRQVLLVSTPRDYYIPLSISNGIPDKLTHAGIYGVDVCMDTMEMLYDTDVDYYFRVNFSGFEQIIDALGGITVYSDFSFDEGMLGQVHHFTKGINHLTGASALAFIHERHAFSDGDRQRGRNQMKVIEGVINKAVSPALLMNYKEIMESVVGCFETSIPYEIIADLVQNQLSEGRDWEITSYSVSGSGASKKPYSLSTNAYVMEPDYTTVETAKQMINQVKSGEILD